MTVSAVRTPLVRSGCDLAAVLTASLPAPLPDRCVVVVATKVVSIAEGRLTGRAGDRAALHDLVRREAEYYLEPHASRYDIMLTIKGNWMFVNAGIDQSNAAGQLAPWRPTRSGAPTSCGAGCANIAASERRLGVILADSGGIPLNWGVVGRGIAHCGFVALRDYTGTPDLHGRPFTMEKTNLVQSIAAAAVLEMGEGAERTPAAVVEHVGRLQFQDREPTGAELSALRISLEDDAYAPILRSAPWQRGAAASVVAAVLAARVRDRGGVWSERGLRRGQFDVVGGMRPLQFFAEQGKFSNSRDTSSGGRPSPRTRRAAPCRPRRAPCRRR